MGITQITALGYPITNIVLCLLGSLGVHVWDMTYSQINYATHGAVAGGTIYYVAVGITKLSIALFVRRMAVAASRKWQLCIDFYVAAVVAYVLLALFWNVFTCRPIPAAWDLVFRGRQAAPPVCMDVVLQSKILGGIHIALGVILLLAVPVIVLCRTQMDSARKVRMYLVCTVGVLGVAAGLLRELRLDIPEDSSWDYVAVLAWTSADLVLGLLVASLPILDGLLARPWHTSPAELASISDSRGDSDSKQQVTSTTTTSSTSSHPPSTYTTRQKNRSVRDIAAALGGGGGGSKRVMKRSESRESIMKKERRSEDTAMEMGILCTQEIRVLYTSRRDIASDGPPTPRREHYLDRAEWRESVQKPEEVAAPLPARKLSSRLKRHA